MGAERLPPGPLEVIDRGRPVSFSLEGRAYVGYAGDTVASALLGAGVEVLGRSFKYHRPRGVLCGQGSCPTCLVTVDGVPNVRACVAPLRPGAEVRRQNAWPSADRDLLALADRCSWLLPVGFYYKIFQRPRWAWPLVEPWIRRAAGLGRLPAEREAPPGEVRTHHPDVLVVGAGPAGLAAAAEAARAGAETLVLDEGTAAGGHLLGWRRAIDAGGGELDGLPGQAVAERLAREATEAGAEILLGTPAFGVFDGPVVAASDGRRLLRIRPRRTVVATGAVEQPLPIADGDRPGVVLAGGADRLVHRYAVLPGRRAVVVAAGARAYPTALGLLAAGVQVLVIDPRARVPEGEVEAVREGGGRVVAGDRVVAVLGSRRVEGVVVRGPGGERSIACDAVVVAGPRIPAVGLLAQAGTPVRFSDGWGLELGPLPPGFLAAGHVRGEMTLAEAIADGRAAGLEAVGRPTGRRPGPARGDDPALADGGNRGKRFVCLCMDVTDHEVEVAVREGFDHPELLKRYTTVTMGPCQGRSCAVASAVTFAASAGRTPVEVPPTTARPPWAPVALGALAGDERRAPRRETPLHHLHERAGARFLWAGEWRRPERYGDPEEEVQAVRTAAGAIDVSTLGKFLVRGPDAAAFLERIYPCRVADLPVGRVRYGLMLNEEGVIIDDGAVCRLGEDEFYLTATTGGAEAVDRWLARWLAAWGGRVEVWNVTGAFAAINLAGPRVREVLAALGAEGLGPEQLGHLGCARATVAGVGATVLRLGFVGELGFEIHVSSGAGAHLWEAIAAAGRAVGLRPFGLEAQRILRLEKGHLIVGQDTDAESDPFAAGLGWAVRLDKGDFLGREALEARARRPAEQRLVGFEAADGVPPEGAAVALDGRPAGRVTSSRRSPTLGRTIGLAWVAAELAEPGRRLEIRAGGRTYEGRVVRPPFYDPSGERQRG